MMSKKKNFSLQRRFILIFLATDAIHRTNWPITEPTHAENAWRWLVHATAARTATAIGTTAPTTAAPAATTWHGGAGSRYQSG